MNDTVTEELTPALFDHAKRLYEAMQERSHKETVSLPTEDMEELGLKPNTVDVYEGHLTRLFAELGLPNPYYTKILDVLKHQNCIEQLRRGGGVAQSRWLLHTPPTEESFKVLMERKRVPKGKMAILDQRQTDLMRLTLDLQDRVDVLTASHEALSKLFDELRDNINAMKGAL